MVKKAIGFVLLMMLLAAQCASALEMGTVQVVNCREYVTLREWASKKAKGISRLPLGAQAFCLGSEEDGFSEVLYEGARGWVLSEYLSPIKEEKGDPIVLTAAETMGLNLYLTGFTQTYLKNYDSAAPNAEEAINFACDYLYFNDYDGLNHGNWSDGNTRVSAERVHEVTRGLLGGTPKDRTTKRGIKYKDGWYYWEETGGHMTSGFAIAEQVFRQEDGLYRVEFSVFGAGENWAPEGVCMFTPRQARAAYKDSGETRGVAVVNMGGDPSDRTRWRLKMLAVN